MAIYIPVVTSTAVSRVVISFVSTLVTKRSLSARWVVQTSFVSYDDMVVLELEHIPCTSSCMVGALVRVARVLVVMVVLECLNSLVV